MIITQLSCVSPILSLESQEQTGQILKQTKYLLVTGKIWQRWTRSDRALAGNPSTRAPISGNILYSCSPLSHRGCTYTRLSIIGQFLVT